MTSAPRPVAISCGEPAGIGPEVTYKAWQAIGHDVPMVWIGDPRHLPSGAVYQVVDNAGDAPAVCGNALPVLARDFGPLSVPGAADPRHARAVIASIETAVELVRSQEACALCTAPIHKAALIDGAGFTYPGHTEFLAALTGSKDVVMMLACDGLRVVPATIHIPIAHVPQAFTQDLLTRTITITAQSLQRDFAIARPRIAVAGLNPHAGEDGKMGREEIDVMIPALNNLRALGLDITGPLSADTMFHPAARARYDVAICAYHDQALIPVKMLDFSGGVNVTLGLPIVRTSPDHGTAFDIAGQGIADPASMIAALRMAHDMGADRDG